MAAKRTIPESKSKRVFGQSRKPVKMLRAGLYSRVSTLNQQTLPMQTRALWEYTAKRGWTGGRRVEGSGLQRGRPRDKSATDRLSEAA